MTEKETNTLGKLIHFVAKFVPPEKRDEFWKRVPNEDIESLLKELGGNGIIVKG